MNVFSALQEYMNYAIDQTPGMKALIMDAATIPIVSILFSMTDIIQKEVYLVQQLSDQARDTLTHLNALVLVRPTKENMELLHHELANPKYGRYYLYFTNFLDSTQITLLSQSDIHELVERVMEIYVDYTPINDDLFITSTPNFFIPSGQDYLLRERQTVANLSALCLSLRKNPSIRYQANSKLAQAIATGLAQTLDSESERFGPPTATTLIVLDRLFDPITPLLTQWTYQAMIHEFIGLEGGKVVVDGKPLVLTNDQFFVQCLYFLFSDVSDQLTLNVSALMQRPGAAPKRYESLDEMKAAIESLPELRKESAGVKKHLALMSAINKEITGRRLFDVSRLEQEIVCGTGKQELYTQLIQFLAGQYAEADKLRLAMLYVLKYEDRLNDVMEELVIKGVSRQKTQLLELALRYSSAAKRPVDLFPRVKSVVNFVKKGVAGVENVFTQHRPLLESLFDAFATQQMTDRFPYCRGGNAAGKEFIVFVAGGVTLEEEVAVAMRNRANPTQRFLLGGTDLLNTTKFLQMLDLVKK